MAESIKTENRRWGISMSSFDMFRRKMEADRCCRLKQESRFIIEGSSATTIEVLTADGEPLDVGPAALTISDKDGPDTSLVFTYKPQKDEQQFLVKGNYFRQKGRNKVFFVYEDVEVVRDVGYVKQKAYECNVRFRFEDEDITRYGYYVSSLAKYVDDTLQNNLSITVNEKPIMILPYKKGVKIGTKLAIVGEEDGKFNLLKPWQVVEIDELTNDGVMYLSLELSSFDKIAPPKMATFTRENSMPTLRANRPITFEIKDGVFKTSSKVQIVSKTASKVVFKIPYGIETITITTLEEGEKTYKVVF